MNYSKYKRFPNVSLKNRTWPDNEILEAPIWCSADLRDGNQALENPMTLSQKIDFFKFLVDIGFKEIEIGFPAASDTEFLFTRTLIEQNLIPDDVTIQVLTQAREHIIKKTFESLNGVKKAIVHFYNSTSTLQRKVVFKKDQEEVKQIAIDGAKLIRDLAKQYGEDRFWFEYSPESFTGTELDYAIDVCNAVSDIIKPTKERKLIINLPATVEMSTPNVHADQIEYMCRNLKNRENLIISLHAHNDRGTAIAATELGLLAGADRVEGTLFGNGERTGNADILNLALNLYSQGIDPKLDFSNIDKAVKIYEESTGIVVHPRHPYAGDLVFTAFSGSHQDAIKKGMDSLKESESTIWEVPYLPIDPFDLGRSYDPIIRINSQSGKGGLSYILENNFGIILPKAFVQHFSSIITKETDKEQKEILPKDIHSIFEKQFVNITSPIELKWYNENYQGDGKCQIDCDMILNGKVIKITGTGNGILDSFTKAIKKALNINFEIIRYNEHSLELSSQSRAITYMEIADETGNHYFGAGISTNISKSSLRALVSAINKILSK